MSSPQIASATKPSLARDWLDALRYWLRGRRGVAVLVVSAVVIGGALNWSWLVAAGIAPLLVAVLPCAAMCALGLCMSRVTGGSCSTSSSATNHPDTPMRNVARPIMAASEPDKEPSVSLTAEAGALPDHSSVGAIEPAPGRQPQARKERK
jgi:hypothetical protein